MTSRFVRIARVESVIDLRSLPAMSGALSSAHRLKWAVYSAFVIRPLPTWSTSGSFHEFGPERFSRPTCLSRIESIDVHESWRSRVVRHSWPPTKRPHSHGLF